VNVTDSGYTPIQVGRHLRGTAGQDDPVIRDALSRARAAADQARTAAEQARAAADQASDPVNVREDEARVGLQTGVILGDVNVAMGRRRKR
jgi:hypothetical protein